MVTCSTRIYCRYSSLSFVASSRANRGYSNSHHVNNRDSTCVLNSVQVNGIEC